MYILQFNEGDTVHNAVIRVSVPIPDYQYCTWNLEDMGRIYTNYQYSTWGWVASEYNPIRKVTDSTTFGWSNFTYLGPIQLIM